MSRLFPSLASLVVLPALLFSATAFAAPPSPPARDPAFEERVVAELRAQAPGEVPAFEEATRALDAQDLPTAERLFGEVVERAPGFVHAKRRECAVLATMGRRDEAITLCRAALNQSPSPENREVLAVALLSAKGHVDAADASEAKSLAEQAAAAKPDDAGAWLALCQAALFTNDAATLQRCSPKLDRVASGNPFTDLCDAFVAQLDGDEDKALLALDRGRTHGMGPAQYTAMRELIEQALAPPWYVRAGKLLGKAVLAWLFVLGALLGAGYALSYATLHALASRPTEAVIRPSERRLRSLYRAVLWAASAYYYVSLPLLALVVVAMMGGVIAVIVATGWIAPKLFIILAFVGVGSLVAIGKSLLVRATDVDPGEPLDLSAHPALRQTLDEVASRIGTRPVDRVFLTPFTEVAVFDRGGLATQLRGASDRCLILGAGVLDGMRLRPFKSILAHEYGHFHNADTAGGGLALAVRRSLSAMTLQLVARRVASPLNPAWWFVRGFWRAFLGISQGASRLQEVLADRWAAFAYGPSAFDRGLRHVVERSVRFEAHLNATIEEVVKTRSALPNLYAFAPSSPKPEGDIAQAIAAALGKKPTPYDSHPCPEDRLAKVRALDVAAGGSAPATPEDDADAWSLFADRAALEARMTAEVRGRLAARRGVVVKGE